MESSVVEWCQRRPWISVGQHDSDPVYIWSLAIRWCALVVSYSSQSCRRSSYNLLDMRRCLDPDVYYSICCPCCFVLLLLWATLYIFGSCFIWFGLFAIAEIIATIYNNIREAWCELYRRCCALLPPSECLVHSQTPVADENAYDLCFSLAGDSSSRFDWVHRCYKRCKWQK